MKTIINIFIISILCSTVSVSQEKQQEVFIIGTMHDVPKIVKKSYKPMLRRAKKYNPQAIYVESPMANDSLSWSYLKKGWSKSYQRFYRLSDSLQKAFDFNASKFNQILSKSHSEMSREDLNYLVKSFGYKRDNGNFEYYNYLRAHGIKGAKKPTRHEDGDLTYKLALELGHKMVINMDDQRTNGKYHAAWNACGQEGRSNGNNTAVSKLNKKSYNSAIIPAIFRGLGNHTNKRKSLERLHKMSSFNYVIEDTKGCKEGRRYWRERNERMADNIATQVIASNKERSVVIVGAAHVIGLEKALKENYPNLKIKLMND